MIALSAAMMLTGAPFDGPIAGLRVGLKDGKPTAFLSADELATGPLDLVVLVQNTPSPWSKAGAQQVSEDQIVEALEYAFKAMQPAIAIQQELV